LEILLIFILTFFQNGFIIKKILLRVIMENGYIYHRVTIGFRPEDEGLYRFFISKLRGRDWGDRSVVGREAIDCLRRVQELAGDDDWREWLDLVEAVMDRDTRGGQEE